MTPLTTKKKRNFDPKRFLNTIGEGRTIVAVSKKQAIYIQGAACDAVFYIQKGKVRLTVISKNGKEATIGILNPGDFFGEGGLAGQPQRLARILLLLAHFGKEGKPEAVVPKISQETLAEMVGTTRSRVSFFMNRFRKLGFIHYNGGLEVHSSLLNVVLHD
ncbi:MAG: Crp/Fnr family transcriptional regulator [Terriglobales bacterium]